MDVSNDYSCLDTIKYPYQVCGIFKTPVRTTSDNIALKYEAMYDR